MSAPCICGHAEHHHATGKDTANPFGCDLCDCFHYSPDPEFRELCERLGARKARLYRANHT